MTDKFEEWLQSRINEETANTGGNSNDCYCSFHKGALHSFKDTLVKYREFLKEQEQSKERLRRLELAAKYAKEYPRG